MANTAMIEASRERAAAAERATRKRCKELSLKGEQARQIQYIEGQIDLAGTPRERDAEDLVTLKGVRKRIMADAERRTNG